MPELDILAIGEPLGEFAETERNGERLFLPGFGGDTSNVAVAAARQGARVGYFTHLGDDAFGQAFLDLWDREGVDRSCVVTRPGSRTGIYFITYGPDGHRFSYVRDGSAASLVGPADLPLDRIAAARCLHVSGISQAISASAADSVFAAIRHARAHGRLVSYDTNLRLALWPLDRARAVIHAAIAGADLARPGLDDARKLTGLEAPDEIVDFYLGLGCRLVAMTLGKDGVLVATASERRLVPPHRVEAVDASGAGDCFGGAFLAEWLAHGDPFRAAAYGNVAAALKTLGQGAVAPVPHRAEVEAALSGRLT
ncbi:sugar kinase [Enterovirga sp.]|uniref:sugar kinase n=1 Tax=Enterovirga sp. TaxID=2026350 RepID=UPI00262B7FBE|nr:sugar kinase [Enterovirga sp.]MDB5591199.1 2-dehydro-3-deoxygluconokinase [Enterovirga sp.]